jgi:HlyD family secretion protein
MKGFIGFAIAAAIAFAGWRWLRGGEGAVRGATVAPEAVFEVRRGDLTISVVENGYLKAKNSVEIKPEFQREGTITWLIEEGKKVEKDEILAEFDKADLETQIAEVEKTLVQNETELETARAELEIQRRDSQAAIETAEFDLRVVTLKLERYEKGEGPNQLRKMRLAAEKARSEFERAQERFEQVPALAAEGFMTKSQVEEERIALREAEINKENAEKDLELHEIYTDPMEREQLQANVRDAERKLVNAREKADINVNERVSRVARAESQVLQTRQRLDKLKKDHALMTMRAPQPGIVHYGEPGNSWLREQVKVGSRFYRGNTMFTLPDLREMQVVVQVHEADIDLVKLGQAVHVSVEAIKGKSFGGKVTEIASVADSNWIDQANRTFEVEITLDPVEIEMRAGITAHVEILVEELKDVVYVPIHAVLAEGGDHFCFVPSGTEFQKRSVEIGKNNLHHVVVAKGLEPSEKVLLYDPRIDAATSEGEAETPLAPEATRAEETTAPAAG